MTVTKESSFGVCAEFVAWRCGVTGRKEDWEPRGLSWNSAYLRCAGVGWIHPSHTFLIGEQGVLRMPSFPHSLQVRNGRAWLRPPFRREPAQGSVWVGSPQLLHLWDGLSQLTQWWGAKWEHWGWGAFVQCRLLSRLVLALLCSVGLKVNFQDYAIVVTFFCLILNGQVIMFIKSIRTF